MNYSKKPTVKMVLDTRHQTKSGEYPLKLRLTIKGRQYYIGIAYTSIENWELMQSGVKLPHQLKQLKDRANMAQAKAFQILDGMQFFSFEKFKMHFAGEAKTSFFQVAQDHKNLLDANGSNTRNFQTTINHLKTFKPGADFADMDTAFFIEFKKYLHRTGCVKPNSQRNHLTNARTVFNKAIKADLIPPQMYPFKSGGVTIGNSASNPRALTPDQLRQLLAYTSNSHAEMFALDWFRLLFVCNGANLASVLNWKKSDVEKGKFSYLRKFNRLTGRGGKVNVVLNDPVLELINRLKSKKIEPGGYLFDVIHDGMTDAEKHLKINYFTGRLNKALRKIGDKLELKRPLSTYWARHSFAIFNIMEHHMTVQELMFYMGHSNLKTAQVYQKITDEMINENKVINNTSAILYG